MLALAFVFLFILLYFNLFLLNCMWDIYTLHILKITFIFKKKYMVSMDDDDDDDHNPQ